jgi:hypothetical protein
MMSGQCRYAALLLFQSRLEKDGRSNRRRLCEERVFLFPAAGAWRALQTAKRRGRQLEHCSGKNYRGEIIHYEFVGVLELRRLDEGLEPDEVWYEFCELLDPMERRERLLPDEAGLRSMQAGMTSNLSGRHGLGRGRA